MYVGASGCEEEAETFDEAFLLQSLHGRTPDDKLLQSVLHSVLVSAVGGAVFQLGAAEHVCRKTQTLNQFFSPAFRRSSSYRVDESPAFSLTALFARTPVCSDPFLSQPASTSSAL